jgi:hypothetical protein
MDGAAVAGQQDCLALNFDGQHAAIGKVGQGGDIVLRHRVESSRLVLQR